MEKHNHNAKEDEEIDVKKIYLRNFKPHQPRVGKQYQAIIPECISQPKKKENKPPIEPKIKIQDDVKINKNILINEKSQEKDEQNKNEIIGHKTKVDNSEKNNKDEYSPHKKKKVI